jgi:hypothetical protein
MRAKNIADKGREKPGSPRMNATDGHRLKTLTTSPVAQPIDLAA